MRRSCFCPKKEDLLAMQQASAENQMLRVQKMNNLRNAATEIVSSDLIYC